MADIDSDLVSELLTLSEDELLLRIGTSLSPRTMFPLTPEKVMQIAKDWLNERIERLRTTTCNSQETKALAKPDISSHEMVVVIAGTLDVGVHLLGGVPAVTVAALIVRIGIHQFCAPIWKSDS